jgi:hypothetical protein
LGRLIKIADEGIPIYTPNDFRASLTPRPLQKPYLEVKNAVHVSVLKNWEKNYVLVLPYNEIQKCGNLHFSDILWVENFGKPNGRTIANASSDSSDTDPLNSKEVKEFGESNFGKLTSPSVIDYVSMFVSAQVYYKEEIDNGDFLVSTKNDINDAFMQMSLQPNSVSKVCFNMVDDYVLVYLTAFFGHTYFPQCWGIINRLLLRLCACFGILFILGYVDDFSSVTLNSKVKKELLAFKKLAEGLLGEGCINEKKYEVGKKLIHIGWEFDLEGGSIGITGRPVGSLFLSRRYQLKVLFVLFNIDISWKLSREMIERIASHMIRVSSHIYPQLRPYATILFAEIHGLNRNIIKEIHQVTTSSIIIWRAFILALILQPNIYKRDFSQIIEKKPIIYANFDASLRGVGIRLFQYYKEGDIGECFKVIQIPLAQDIFNFSASNDSSYQNAVEFMAVTLVLFILVHLGFSNIKIHLGGDSMSALYWACFSRFKGNRSIHSAYAQTAVSLAASIQVDKNFSHLSVIDSVEANYDSDYTSRESRERIISRYPTEIYMDLVTDPWLNRVLELCNPELQFKSIGEEVGFRNKLSSLIEFVKSEGVSKKEPMKNEDFNSVSLQLFISASIVNKPLNSISKRSAWTWYGSSSTSVTEFLQVLAVEYSDHKKILKWQIPRKNLILNNVDGKVKLSELLQNGDVVILKGFLKGGMKRSIMDIFNECDDTIREVNGWMRDRKLLGAPLNSDYRSQLVENLFLNHSPYSVAPVHDNFHTVSSTHDTIIPVKSDTSIVQIDSVVIESKFDYQSSQSLVPFDEYDRRPFLRTGDLEVVNETVGVAGGTIKAYSRDGFLWTKFLSNRNQLEILFLENVPTRDQRVIMANFVSWLKRYANLSEARISSVMSAVRYFFLKAGVDVSIFSDPLVSLVKKDIKETSRTSSIRRLTGKGARQPACFEFLAPILDWCNEAISGKLAEYLKRKCAYLACNFLYNFGARYGNVGYDLLTGGEHAVKRCDILIQDQSGRRYNIPQFFKYITELGILEDTEAVVERVLLLVIYIHSSKVRKKVGRIEFLAKRSIHEEKYLRMLVIWCLFESGLGCDEECEEDNYDRYLPDNLLFSRRHSKGKIIYNANLQRKELSTATKIGAVRCGLDPKYFTSHSWKIASISEMVAQGEEADVVRRLGDHAVNSVSTFLYQRESGREKRPLIVATSGKGLSVRDISSSCPTSEVPLESLSKGWKPSPVVEFEGFDEKEYDDENSSSSDSGSDND